MPSLSDLTLQAYMSVFELRFLDKEVGSKDVLQVKEVAAEKKEHVKVGVYVVSVSCKAFMAGEVVKVEQASTTVAESEKQIQMQMQNRINDAKKFRPGDLDQLKVS